MRANIIKFQSQLKRISNAKEYFAIPVPAKVSKQLGIKGPVPVSASVNGSKPFLISLYPLGDGTHGMRVKAQVRKEVNLEEDDCVQVQISVRDREDEVAIPKDLMTALRAEGVLKSFKDISIGSRSFMLRKIEAAAKPETRQKRIQEVVEAAQAKREKSADRS